MDARQLRKRQAPIKAPLREDPSAARITLAATGRIDECAVVCEVKTGHAVVKAGLHPSVGGDENGLFG